MSRGVRRNDGSAIGATPKRYHRTAVFFGDAVDVINAKDVANKGSAKSARTADKQDAADKVPAPPALPGNKAPAPVGRKPAGVKEVIPFEWKLVGESHELALTLFKAIVREDVDAQFERVHREGYYRNLRVLGIDEKVEQPSPAKSRRTVKKPTNKKVTTRTAKRKRAASKTGGPKRTSKASASSRRGGRAKAAKTSKVKVTATSAKKATAAKKTAKRRKVKKSKR